MSQPVFPQAAYDVLVSNIQPVFFEKLARDWNPGPSRASKELRAFWSSALLREAKEQEAIKTAAHGNSFIAEASDRLKQAMADFGYCNCHLSRGRPSPGCG